MGLYYPTEKTAACATAVMLGVAQEDVAVANSILLILRDFKLALKSRVARAGKPSVQLPVVYHDDPATLRDSHPFLYAAAYSKEEPAKSPLSPAQWAYTISMVIAAMLEDMQKRTSEIPQRRP